MLYKQKVFPIKTIHMFDLSSNKSYLPVTFKKSNYIKEEVCYKSRSKEESNGNFVLMERIFVQNG